MPGPKYVRICTPNSHLFQAWNSRLFLVTAWWIIGPSNRKKSPQSPTIPTNRHQRVNDKKLWFLAVLLLNKNNQHIFYDIKIRRNFLISNEKIYFFLLPNQKANNNERKFFIIYFFWFAVVKKLSKRKEITKYINFFILFFFIRKISNTWGHFFNIFLPKFFIHFFWWIWIQF